MTITVEPLQDRKAKRAVNHNGRAVSTITGSYRLTSSAQLDPEQARIEFSNQTNVREFSLHSSNLSASVRSIDVTAEKTRSPWTYMIHVEWSTETPDQNQADREQDDPMAEPVEIEIDGESIQMPLFKDINDTLIANTIGDPIGGLEEEIPIEVLTFVRNEPRRNSARDRLYRGKVNQNAIWGASQDQVKCRSIRAKRHFRRGIEYWVYTYTFAYNPRGWQEKVLNAGLYQNKTGSPVIVRQPCVDNNGEPVTESVPLDVNGFQIAQANLPGAAHYLDFDTVERADFAALGLPMN